MRKNFLFLPYIDTDTDKARDVRHITCLHLPSKKKRKRGAIDVFTEDAGTGNENSSPRQPLVPVRGQSDSTTNNKRLMVYYTLEGRAGKMVVPDNVLLPISEMRENLPPLPYTDTDTDKARDVRHITCLYLASLVW